MLSGLPSSPWAWQADTSITVLPLCASGTCPLTSTPYYSMLVGGLLGALAGDLLSALRARLTSRSSQ